MSDLFLNVLNLSYCALWVVPLLLAARLLLKKAPRSLVCSLWLILAVRLMFGGVAAPFSLLPSTQIIPPESLFSQSPEIQSGIDAIDKAINPAYTESLRPVPGASINPLQVWIGVYANIWFLGMSAMALWALISCRRIRRLTRESLQLEEGVFLCDNIPSPFLFGLFCPVVYLPSGLDEGLRPHILAHERAHIRRRDHWWKPLAFLLLTVHWFNPALWLCYILLCRDIELACDECVTKHLSASERKAYSAALLECSLSRRTIAVCPLAFGEGDVRHRIQSILSYKKPSFWLLLTAVILSAVLAVGLLADPALPSPDPGESTPVIPLPTEYESPLGIALRVENVTPSGATLVCTQDGTPWDQIITGSPWALERLQDGQWVSMMPESTVWTSVAYGINQGTETRWNINWKQLVGEIPPGHYRIGKTFHGTRIPPFTVNPMGDTTEKTCYAEFDITDGFSAALHQAIRDSWTAYDSMPPMMQLASSTLPGSCIRDFDRWEDVEQFVGVTIPNPLEKLNHLEKGNWAAAPEGYNGGSRFHVTFQGTRDGQVQNLTVEAGYRIKDQRITMTAQLCGDPEIAAPGWSVISPDSGEGYEARTGMLTLGAVQYTVRVMGEPGTGDSLDALLQALMPYFEEIPIA